MIFLTPGVDLKDWLLSRVHWQTWLLSRVHCQTGFSARCTVRLASQQGALSDWLLNRVHCQRRRWFLLWWLGCNTTPPCNIIWLLASVLASFGVLSLITGIFITFISAHTLAGNSAMLQCRRITKWMNVMPFFFFFNNWKWNLCREHVC